MQVNEPTCKHNILDLIFCSDELINSVTTIDTFLSYHRIINFRTCIPIPKDIIQIKSLNPTSNNFERCDWPQLADALRNLDWAHEQCSATRNVTSICHINYYRQMYAVCFQKHGKNKLITSFHRKRIILMRKIRKLAKSHILVSEKTAQILHVEELICESHRQEKLHDEEIVLTKIKMDPN